MRSIYFLAALSLAAAAPAHATDARSADVVKAFDMMCKNQVPQFDQMVQLAATTGMMEVKQENAPPSASPLVREKRWAGNLPSGPFVFMAGEIKGVKGVTTTCSVAADVASADDLRATAEKQFKLGAGVKPQAQPNGSRIFNYGTVQSNAGVLIQDFKPKGQERVMLKVVVLSRLK